MPENKTQNPGQLAAMHHGTGPLLVLAGPGSGKTYTITRRIRWLIEEKGVEPSSILVITFTRAAAVEMRQRFLRLTEGKSYPVWFGTFHAVYYHILKNAYHYRSGNILSETEKREIAKMILLRPESPECQGEDTLELLLAQISRYKNEGCRESVLNKIEGLWTKEEFLRLYQAYEQTLETEKKLDFDDMVLRCHQLFTQYPAILRAWQQKIRYILVDEFQDINREQYEVLRMLALPENNLFVVGDDDQSIYAFRGAKPEIMRRFLSDYPSARQTELAINYRSTPQIVSAAARLITKNKDRMPKRAEAAKPAGKPVLFCGYRDRKEQNLAIAEKLKEGQAEGKTQAVIFRTNQDACELAELLTSRGLPFCLRERIKSPYRQETAQDLLSYLSFALEGEKRSDFYRIMNRPKRYIGRAAVAGERVDFKSLLAYYSQKPYMHPILRRLQLDVSRLKRMDLFAAVNYIRKGMGYEEYLKQEALRRGKDFRELAAQADWFQRQVREFKNVQELKEHILLYEKELEKAQSQKKEEGICLLTMHASKGLEYDRVYIPDCNEGIIPHRKSMAENQIEEERRMLYVAMTRAREELTISWVAGTEEEPGLLSRFLSDMKAPYSGRSSSNSQLSRYSSKASATASYSSSSSM